MLLTVLLCASNQGVFPYFTLNLTEATKPRRHFRMNFFYVFERINYGFILLETLFFFLFTVLVVYNYLVD